MNSICVSIIFIGHLVFSIIRWVSIAVCIFKEFLSLEGCFVVSFFFK